jgi:hypothetical protein
MPDEGWNPISNAASRTGAITNRARGLLTKLLSYPPKNNMTLDKVVKQGPRDPITGRPLEGRGAMQAAMRELERAGYVFHDRHRSEGGRWSSTVHVCDDAAVLAGRLRQSPQPSSGQPSSAGPSSAGPPSTTCKTVMKDGGGRDCGLQSSSSLAVAREGEVRARARDDADLDALYEAANGLGDDPLRRLLLAFEKKRPAVYRRCRNSALDHLDREAPEMTRGPDGVRAVDLLSYKYALQRYGSRDAELPSWLTRFPRS